MKHTGMDAERMFGQGTPMQYILENRRGHRRNVSEWEYLKLRQDKDWEQILATKDVVVLREREI